jgi:hypothetical protein
LNRRHLDHKIPLYPPFPKGDFSEPLFEKEGQGRFSNGCTKIFFVFCREVTRKESNGVKHPVAFFGLKNKEIV